MKQAASLLFWHIGTLSLCTWAAHRPCTHKSFGCFCRDFIWTLTGQTGGKIYISEVTET